MHKSTDDTSRTALPRALRKCRRIRDILRTCNLQFRSEKPDMRPNMFRHVELDGVHKTCNHQLFRNKWRSGQHMAGTRKIRCLPNSHLGTVGDRQPSLQLASVPGHKSNTSPGLVQRKSHKTRDTANILRLDSRNFLEGTERHTSHPVDSAYTQCIE